MSTHALPTTLARKRFLSIVRDAGASYARYVITHRGRPEAVVMSADEFEGWLETLEIAESSSWRKALAKARQEEKAGRRLSFETVVGRKASRRA
ncbi:MAG: type II toxin-antitoxin system Phd/YefM family antitoxin [Elusimicrobia bacterium]|nr:type II toxin-antitoxin system Phd/YefM family antitoxin [Elusimicrobiota bacterium]